MNEIVANGKSSRNFEELRFSPHLTFRSSSYTLSCLELKKMKNPVSALDETINLHAPL
jgi:hypothetical protein